MSVEVADPLEQRGSTSLHRLIFRDQKPPLLQIVAFNRPVVAVVAHRIVLQRSDPISELVNMHNCEERLRRPFFACCASFAGQESAEAPQREGGSKP